MRGLSKKLGVSQSAVMELAIRLLAKREGVVVEDRNGEDEVRL